MRFLADLALFVEVANTRNFGRAAAALGMPASTLSRRISALERELGLQLIHRSSRVFTLTDAGKACYEQSKVLVAEAKRIQEGIAVISSEASSSSVSMSKNLARLSSPAKLSLVSSPESG